MILRAPTIAHPVEIHGHPHLAHAVWLRAPDTFDVRVVLSPVLDLLHRGGTRLAVSFDDQPPQTLTAVADSSPGSAGFAAWERSVQDSVYVARGALATAGAQVLKLWPLDPGWYSSASKSRAAPFRRATWGHRKAAGFDRATTVAGS